MMRADRCSKPRHGSVAHEPEENESAEGEMGSMAIDRRKFIQGSAGIAAVAAWPSFAQQSLDTVSVIELV
jgi:secreted PhoX family phosphatase